MRFMGVCLLMPSHLFPFQMLQLILFYNPIHKDTVAHSKFRIPSKKAGIV